MLNWLLLYSFIMSFILRLYYHGKTAVPGNEGGALKWVAMAYFRGVALSAIVLIGIHSGIFGPGYMAWWVTYSTDHSMILWFFVVVPITLSLYLMKEITFSVMKKAGSYGWFEGNPPSLFTLNMRMPLVWNLVFWGWMFLCPWLPFASCFLHIFLFKTPPSTVFPSV